MIPKNKGQFYPPITHVMVGDYALQFPSFTSTLFYIVLYIHVTYILQHNTSHVQDTSIQMYMMDVDVIHEHSISCWCKGDNFLCMPIYVNAHTQHVEISLSASSYVNWLTKLVILWTNETPLASPSLMRQLCS